MVEELQKYGNYNRVFFENFKKTIKFAIAKVIVGAKLINARGNNKQGNVSLNRETILESGNMSLNRGIIFKQEINL